MKRAAVLVCLLLGACASGPRDHVSLPAPPPSGEPAGMVGLKAAELRASFGAPAFIRKDGGIEMWRFDGASCKAFFFLYPQAGGAVVRHVETLPRGTSIAADTNCLTLLRHPIS